MDPASSPNVGTQAWPIYYREKLHVGNLDRNVGIATLWTPLELVAKHLSKEDYAVIGQLYSKTEGLNALLRNCLANPSLRTIIVYGQDRTGSGEMLLKLMKHGIDKTHRILGTDVYVDAEIPAEAVERFRGNVEILDLRTAPGPQAVAAAIQGRPRKHPYGQPEVFPPSKVTPPATFPAENAGFLVRSRLIGEGWLLILDLIHRFGMQKQSHESEPYREIVDLMSVVTDENPLNPVLQPYLPFSRDELERYLPQVLTDQEHEDISYTYGQRLMKHFGVNQIRRVVEKLKETPNTRRALAVTWDVRIDLENENPPCVDTLQWLTRGGKITLTAYIRSNDVFAAWPQNAFALRKLQHEVCQAVNEEQPENLRLSIGNLVTISASAHIYLRDLRAATEILKDYSPKNSVSRQFMGGMELDPRGNITISIRDGRVHLSHLDSDGTRIDEYAADNVRNAQAWLTQNQKIGDLSHALYLGRELEKAHLAMKYNLQYEQDKPLPLKHTAFK